MPAFCVRENYKKGIPPGKIIAEFQDDLKGMIIYMYTTEFGEEFFAYDSNNNQYARCYYFG